MSGTIDDRKLVQVLRALADAKRFRMVQQIAAAGELSCGQVAERFSLSQPTVSHHLKLLGSAGVIRIRNEGQHRFISVDHDLLERVVGAIPGRIAEPTYRARMREALDEASGTMPAKAARSSKQAGKPARKSRAAARATAR